MAHVSGCLGIWIWCSSNDSTAFLGKYLTIRYLDLGTPSDLQALLLQDTTASTA